MLQQLNETYLGSLPPLALVSILLLGSWAIWRVWRFTIVPWIWPNHVPDLPYVIPFIGHAFSLLRDWDGTMSGGVKYFGNTHRTFALTVAGKKLYIVTDPVNIEKISKGSLAEGYDAQPGKDFIMSGFGASKKAFDILRATPSEGFHDAHPFLEPNPSSKPAMVMAQKLIHRQLNPGKQYNEFEAGFMAHIDAQLRPGCINPNVIVESQYPFGGGEKKGEETTTVSLFQLARHTLVKSTTLAFFGPAIFEVAPQYVEHFLAFDDGAPTFLCKVANPFGASIASHLTHMRESIVSYLQLPSEKREGACWLVKTLETELGTRGIDISDIATYLILVQWGMNSNTWRLVFWALCHLFTTPGLAEAIREETAPVLADFDSYTNLHSRLLQCKRLGSLYNELVRLTSGSVSMRMATKPLKTARGEFVPRGVSLVLVHRQTSLDPRVWGPKNPLEFDGDRFLRDESLAKSKSFTPFGSGPLMCPGRTMNRAEVMGFVAFMVGRFDVKVVPGIPFPRKDYFTNAGVATMGPIAGDDMRVVLSTKRTTENP